MGNSELSQGLSPSILRLSLIGPKKPESRDAVTTPGENSISGCTIAESRVLAIDLGDKRIGLAVSDPLGLTAQGLPTLLRRNKRQDLNFLRSLARQYGVSLIVLGNPLRMNGSEGRQSEKAQDFAKELEQHLNVEVRLWDERLTSVEATRLLRQSGVGRRAGREQVVDRLAAALLLENFLDSRRNRSESEA